MVCVCGGGGGWGVGGWGGEGGVGGHLSLPSNEERSHAYLRIPNK